MVISLARSGDRRVLRLLQLCGLLVCFGYLLSEAVVVSFEMGFPLDDSWIHLQFARSLAAGHGLAYQSGEWVTGSTAPLWTALLAPLMLLSGTPVLWTKLLGVTLYMGCIDATYRLARELGLEARLALLAAMFFLATDWMVWSALSGMEILLFTWLSLWGMILHARERPEPHRPGMALLVLAIATLVRPEGLLLLALAVVDRLLRLTRQSGESLGLVAQAWRATLQGLALAALALGPVLAFYAAVGSSTLPNTYAVKTVGVTSLLPWPRYLYTVMGILFRPQPVLFLLAGAGLLDLLERQGTRRDRGLLPALWLLGLPLAYSMLSPRNQAPLVGNFGRYFFPLFPVVIVLGILGLRRAWEHLGPWARVGSRRVPLRGLFVAVTLLPTLFSLVSGAGRYARNVLDVQNSDVRVTDWLRHNVRPDALLAVQDIGAVKFFLPNPVLDLTGIVNPEILPYIKGELVGTDPYRLSGLLAYLEEKGPDYLVVFPTSYPGLTQLRPELEPVHRLRLDGNITMAGNELVVYRTPWQRSDRPASDFQTGRGDR